MSVTRQDNDHAGKTWRGVSKEDKERVREDLIKPPPLNLDNGQNSTSLVAAKLNNGQNSASLVAAKLDNGQNSVSPLAAKLDNGQNSVSEPPLNLENSEISVSSGQKKISNSEQYAIVPDNKESPKAMLKFKADDGKYYALEVITYHKGFLKLPGVLKHPNAEKFKNAAVEKMADFMAGNERHLRETVFNAQSTNPLNVIMRESIEASEALRASGIAAAVEPSERLEEQEDIENMMDQDANVIEEEAMDPPMEVIPKQGLKIDNHTGGSIMITSAQLSVVAQMDDKGLKNVREMFHIKDESLDKEHKRQMEKYQLHKARELMEVDVQKARDMADIKEASLDKEHQRMLQRERDMAKAKEEGLDKEHQRQMEMLKLKAVIARGGDVVNFDSATVPEVVIPETSTKKRTREPKTGPRHLPAATSTGMKFFHQFMSSLVATPNMAGCKVTEFHGMYAKWAEGQNVPAMDRFSRHSLSSKAREVDGVSSQRMGGGVKYWFDHDMIKEYLEKEGVWDEEAEPLESE
jgi:hypothetical protein